MKKHKQKLSPLNNTKKDYKKSIISIISFFISVASLGISFFTLSLDQQSSPLSYYLKPTITSFTSDKVYVEVEVMVTNGAVGDIRIIDYQNGKLTDIANNVGGMITPRSNKGQRTLEFEFSYEASLDHFFMTEYALIHGKDGSKTLGMILFDVNLPYHTITVDYYSLEDVILSEMNPDEQSYSKAFSNYREFYEVLKTTGAL